MSLTDCSYKDWDSTSTPGNTCMEEECMSYGRYLFLKMAANSHGISTTTSKGYGWPQHHHPYEILLQWFLQGRYLQTALWTCNRPTYQWFP